MRISSYVQGERNQGQQGSVCGFIQGNLNMRSGVAKGMYWHNVSRLLFLGGLSPYLPLGRWPMWVEHLLSGPVRKPTGCSG